MSESIYINNELLIFNKIWYVDDNFGDDGTGDGSQSSPYKTINKAINMQAQNDCIYINEGTYYPNPLFYSGDREVTMYLIKPLTIIGQSNMKTVIKSTRTGQMQQYSTFMAITNTIYGTHRTINLKFQFDYPIFSIIGDIPGYNPVNWFIDNCIFEFPQNDYIHFSNNTVEMSKTSGCVIRNCVFKINNIAKYANRNNYTFINCQFDKLDVNVDSFSEYSCNNLYEVQFDENYNILNKPFKNLGDPDILNPDSSISNIGLFGGPFQSMEIITYYLIKYQNQLKKFNSNNNTFEDISDNQLSLSNFETYGYKSLSQLISDIKTYYPIMTSFELFINSNDLQKYRLMKESVLNSNIIKVKSINIENMNNLEYIKIYLNELNLDDEIRIIFKKNNKFISLKNNKIYEIDLQNISTNNLMSVIEFNTISYDNLLLCSDDYILNIYIYSHNKNKINNISLKSDIIGKYNLYETTKLFNNKKISVNMNNNGIYKFNLFKRM